MKCELCKKDKRLLKKELDERESIKELKLYYSNHLKRFHKEDSPKP